MAASCAGINPYTGANVKYSPMSLRNLLQPLLLFLLLSGCAQSPDDKAKSIAREVMENMGGEKGWNDTRYLAWTFNNQYQVWDKHQNRFRWEQDSLVAIINTDTKDGKVYVEGQELQNSEEKQKLLERAYALWINNSYWLVMPFKLQDEGVTLRYVGEEQTLEGAPADVLEMTFAQVGLTPQNKYKLWVDKEQGLVTQWAFFRSAEDAEPSFTRRWSDYKDYGSIKLASDRSNSQGEFKLTNIAAPAEVPDSVFNSPTPIEKL
ncbi:hypothetical protein [Pontibacter sp. HSC-36F09]|uniref:hypothetical protein n=1 Tax=Pontibacter sp. HSC-36F09 TaxID=2910966 RepID=UPI00209CA171|nr:hypothetical protein [Pontibacter sp. HSC-36F09]MCP2042732.1 outer membrane lipoprotein-sorting protein [Pontibacter sp. HSC-36F09]